MGLSVGMGNMNVSGGGGGGRQGQGRRDESLGRGGGGGGYAQDEYDGYEFGGNEGRGQGRDGGGVPIHAPSPTRGVGMGMGGMMGRSPSFGAFGERVAGGGGGGGGMAGGHGHGGGQGQGQVPTKEWADAYFGAAPPPPPQQPPQQQRLNINTNPGGMQRGGGPVSPGTGRYSAGGQGQYSQQQPPYSPHAHPGQHQGPGAGQQQQQHQLADLGKGLPLHAVPPEWPLYIVEFKAGRTDLFYRAADRMASQNGRNGAGNGYVDDDPIRVGDLVIVEADRGKDLGKVVNDSITLGEVEAFWAGQQRFGSGQSPPTSPGGAEGGGANGGGSGGKKEIAPKMIYGKAGAGDAQLLVAKMQDELKALALCQTKVRAKKLPMEVVDAEYQDRRKLTFYFVAEKRIDFRELVRELFRLYKTRIWMASLQGAGGFEQ
ncbi:PSP1 C-terminal conserved region-domain-containing protein [Favolaschia claudopus]|uniref:PSP1 C-terminal conserved region-domain-containing protein n=1 Tax=Favolaschia claudopus TaxID=2862362 RepID=A0AAW0AG15_9AGAR